MINEKTIWTRCWYLTEDIICFGHYPLNSIIIESIKMKASFWIRMNSNTKIDWIQSTIRKLTDLLELWSIYGIEDVALYDSKSIWSIPINLINCQCAHYGFKSLSKLIVSRLRVLTSDIDELVDNKIRKADNIQSRVFTRNLEWPWVSFILSWLQRKLREDSWIKAHIFQYLA